MAYYDTTTLQEEKTEFQNWQSACLLQQAASVVTNTSSKLGLLRKLPSATFILGIHCFLGFLKAARRITPLPYSTECCSAAEQLLTRDAQISAEKRVDANS